MNVSMEFKCHKHKELGDVVEFIFQNCPKYNFLSCNILSYNYKQETVEIPVIMTCYYFYPFIIWIICLDNDRFFFVVLYILMVTD